jgi:uncharacterized protein with HEPN domain
MSKRKPDVYLQDILESISHIQRFLERVSENELYKKLGIPAEVLIQETEPIT